MANLIRKDTPLPGVWELQTKIFRDSRGFFLETYKSNEFTALGITETFVQDNHSWSKKGVLRGLHYQLRSAQAKLCRVAEGESLDVAVDIRLGSPDWGKWMSVQLSAEAQNQIYIPPGFARGFVALTDSVQFRYKCSAYYQAADEYGILWNDPELGIEWGIKQPIISGKDSKLPTLASIARENLPKYTGKHS
jgi:dTDP-4-dehydrorhamnose 3,5-epimerase